MNRWFSTFIRDAKKRAASAGLPWSLRVGADGRVAMDQRWDLSAAVRAPPPRTLLSSLGTYESCLAILNARRAAAGQPGVELRPLGRGWQALIKATVLDQLLVRGNQPLKRCRQIAPGGADEPQTGSAIGGPYRVGTASAGRCCRGSG